MGIQKSAYEEVLSASFFTAMDGVLGKAVTSCKPSTRVKNIVSRDGTYSEERLDCLTICTLVLQDGTVVLGSYASKKPLPSCNKSGRVCAYNDAMKKVQKHMKKKGI